MVDTLVILGGIVLDDFEIPERISNGGKHTLAVQTLVGGTRVVDAMGPDPDPRAWEGRFRGPDALERCLAVEAMKNAGAQVELSFLGLFYTVVIQEFSWSPERFYEIPYRISCLVVDDPFADSSASPLASLDSLVQSDLSSAGNAAVNAPASVAPAVAALTTAIGAVGTLADATTAQSNALLVSIASTSAQLDTVARGFEATLGAALPLDPADLANALSGMAGASLQEAATLATQSYLNRAGLNIDLNG